jgi:hypothetical protein
MLLGAVQAASWCIGMAYNAIGRPSILLWLSVLRATIILPTIWLVREQDLIIIVYCFTAAQIVPIVFNLVVARAVLGVSLKRLAIGVLPIAIAVSTMTLTVVGARQFDSFAEIPHWGQLSALALAGGLTYVATILLAAPASVRDIVLVLRRARVGA